MTNETNEAHGVSNSLKLPLKFIIENKPTKAVRGGNGKYYPLKKKTA